MPVQNRPVEPNAFRDLMARVARLEFELKRQGRVLLTMDRLETLSDEFPAPSEGQLAVEHPGNSLRYYANQRWYGGPIFAIKVFSDLATVTTGDGKFKFSIPEDVDGMTLINAEAFVTTAGSCTVQISNQTQAVDMLSTALTIDGGEYSSHTAATPHVINTANDLVAVDDRIWIDVDAASGCKGLGVFLHFA